MLSFLRRLLARPKAAPSAIVDAPWSSTSHFDSWQPTPVPTGRKAAPSALVGGQWSGSSYVDSWKRTREPSPNELVSELKGVAWACVSLNAGVCATYSPNLYVVTRHNHPKPKCATQPISTKTAQRFAASHPTLAGSTIVKGAALIEEVTDHPLLDLLRRPNPMMTGHDLWELTQTYLEVTGRAFWYLENGPFGVPANIWILPTQNVTPRRRDDSPNPIDYYEYRTGRRYQEFPLESVVFFRYPDPRDPYVGGLSPLRACYEQVVLTSEFAATKSAIYENRGIPSALIAPDDLIGEEERDRLENEWNRKFRRGGAGRVVVAESNMKLQLLSQSMGDLAALADMKATKEDIANAFHVPIAFFTTQTNLANLQASQAQHMTQAISPRVSRRDNRLNHSLVPLFDPSGRLFLSSEDPMPVDQEAGLAQLGLDLEYGVLSINEVRSGRGLAPVPWGAQPWLPIRWAPTNQPRVSDRNESNISFDS
jgi:HK97 family phage portal protein